jgi:uncharacterized protein YegJ (DUF2314 family)
MKNIIIVAVLVVLAIGAYVWVKRYSRGKKAEEPLVSMVYLLEAPRQLTAEDLRACVSRAFGVTLDVDNPDAAEFVLPAPAPPRDMMPADNAQSFVIQVSQGAFIVHNAPAPYVDEPDEFAKTIVDKRLRDAISTHKAWLSVDALDDVGDNEARADAYRAIGKLMAELAGPDCLAIYCPELERCNEYDAQLLVALRGDDPLSLFEGPTFAPIIGVRGDDPRMAAAVEEARTRWPEFAAAFQANHDEDKPFLIKAEFRQGETAEFMWVTVTRIEEEIVHGVLENTPHELTNVREGDEVAVPLSALNDWLYVKDDEPVGGFTLKAIAEIEREE